ncbi:type 2 periplasmic-binding domain-containing protein [Serratia ureilytica]|uniref:hypothetical protein n=1 Tax=Serratia ureilytica TaxID=300181 RepID=UPI00164EF354|nr:hypothetical protein [Serratia ureilytica]
MNGPVYRDAYTGIGVLQEPAATEALKKGELIEILPDYSIPKFEINILTRSQQPVPKKIKHIIDVIRLELAKTINKSHRNKLT